MRTSIWGLGCCHFTLHKPHKAIRSASDEENDGESESEKENNSECQSCSDCRGEKGHPIDFVPDPNITRVSVGDKFNVEGVELIEGDVKKNKHKKHKRKDE